MGRNVLITGASRGIGAAIATEYAAGGYDLILNTSKSSADLNTLAFKLITQYGINCINSIGDIGDPDYVRKLFSSVEHLDVLINNAGVSYIGLIQDMTDADWRRVIDTNLSGVFYTCREASRLMLKEHAGSIINISSIWGDQGASMEVAYSASKGGVNTFTRALAKELAPSGISVNAISCGVINTSMNSCFSEEEMKQIIEEIPKGRLGTPEEVAKVAFYLGNAPEYLTGQIIGVDGAY